MRSILFFGLLIVLMLVASRVFTPKNNVKDSALKSENVNGIKGENKDSIDVLILGDSEAYCSISPMEMWHKQGITSYVCGTSGQYIYVSYDILNDVLKDQDIKTVVLETNTIYRHFDTSKYLFARGKLVFPLLQYHNRWKTINLKDFYASVDYEWRDFKKGYIYQNQIVPASTEDYMKSNDHSKKPEDLNKKCFEDIVNVCKDNDTKLVLLSTPSTKNWNYEKHNGVKELADKYDITYIDLNLKNKDIGLDWKQDTKDKGDHMNYHGAVKVSNYLADFLKKEYKLADHRNDDKYKTWHEDYNHYSEYVK